MRSVALGAWYDSWGPQTRLKGNLSPHTSPSKLAKENHRLKKNPKKGGDGRLRAQEDNLRQSLGQIWGIPTDPDLQHTIQIQRSSQKNTIEKWREQFLFDHNSMYTHWIAPVFLVTSTYLWFQPEQTAHLISSN